MFVDCFHDAGQHQQELDVVMGGFAWVQQVNSVVRDNGPVVVLARAVYPCKGLFVEQAG